MITNLFLFVMQVFLESINSCSGTRLGCKNDLIQIAIKSCGQILVVIFFEVIYKRLDSIFSYQCDHTPAPSELGKFQNQIFSVVTTKQTRKITLLLLAWLPNNGYGIFLQADPAADGYIRTSHGSCDANQT